MTGLRISNWRRFRHNDCRIVHYYFVKNWCTTIAKQNSTGRRIQTQDSRIVLDIDQNLVVNSKETTKATGKIQTQDHETAFLLNIGQYLVDDSKGKTKATPTTPTPGQWPRKDEGYAEDSNPGRGSRNIHATGRIAQTQTIRWNYYFSFVRLTDGFSQRYINQEMWFQFWRNVLPH